MTSPVAARRAHRGCLVAFGVSRPLPRKVGAWPAVFGVTGSVALVSWTVADRHGHERHISRSAHHHPPLEVGQRRRVRPERVIDRARLQRHRDHRA
ncbi:hypothetical protein GTY92_10520 [Streptomyces sp. SID4950]|nr:hypothetical protein [Streptomyces sp. SID4950]